MRPATRGAAARSSPGSREHRVPPERLRAPVVLEGRGAAARHADRSGARARAREGVGDRGEARRGCAPAGGPTVEGRGRGRAPAR